MAIENSNPRNVYNFVAKTGPNPISVELAQHNLVKLAGESHSMVDFLEVIRAQNLLVQSGHSLEDTTYFLEKQHNKNHENSTADIARTNLNFIYKNLGLNTENQQKAYEEALALANRNKLYAPFKIGTANYINGMGRALANKSLRETAREENLHIRPVNELLEATQNAFLRVSKLDDKHVCGSVRTTVADGTAVIPKTCSDENNDRETLVPK